jgi:hypothetical protein
LRNSPCDDLDGFEERAKGSFFLLGDDVLPGIFSVNNFLVQFSVKESSNSLATDFKIKKQVDIE